MMMRWNNYTGAYSGIRNVMYMTLGDIVESFSFEPMTTNEKIEAAREKIFRFHYPVWNEQHKKHFETLFIRKFYFNEISAETEGQFLFKLETWCMENMEFYKKRLASQIWEDMIKNPLANYEVFENTSNASSSEQIESVMQALERLQSDVAQLSKDVLQTDNATSSRTEEINGATTNNNTKTLNDKQTDTKNNTEETSDTSTFEKTSSDQRTTENEKEQLQVANEVENALDNSQNVSATNSVTDKNVFNETDRNEARNEVKDKATSAESETTANEDETNTDFKRDIHTNTPQTRLQITTGADGTGVIEHATTINESKDKRVKDNERTEVQSATGDENERSTASTAQHETGNVDENERSTSSQTENATSEKEQRKTASQSANETERLNEANSSAESTTQTDTHTSNATETNEHTQTLTDADVGETTNVQTLQDASTTAAEHVGKETGNENRTTDTEEKGTTERVLSQQDTSSMSSHKYGSIGVQTYDQLLNGYRTIFMRVESEMLEEMHSALFMLTY